MRTHTPDLSGRHLRTLPFHHSQHFVMGIKHITSQDNGILMRHIHQSYSKPVLVYVSRALKIAVCLVHF